MRMMVMLLLLLLLLLPLLKHMWMRSCADVLRGR